VAGLRIALTTTVGLAALAFHAGGGGLGQALASQKQFQTNVLLAGGLCVVMAVLLDAAVLGAQRVLTPWSKARAT
jgi:osmoprotectant transport system permease protein